MKKKHLIIVDILKAVAIICVIITHCDLYAHGLPHNHIIYCLFIDMAVPLFLLISGYNYVTSCYANDRTRFCKLYNIQILKKQFFRIMMPYTAIFLLAMPFWQGGGYKKHSVLIQYIIGGEGPGGYYVPIMIQFIIFMPIIFILIYKTGETGVILCFISNWIFEYFVKVTDFPSNIYRLFIGRYLFLLALGSVMAYIERKKKRLKKSALIISFLCGLFYVLYTNSFRLPDASYSWSILKYWQSTGMFVGLYIFPIFYFLLHHYRQNIIKERIIVNILQIIGKSSWHIFLVQTLYFSILYKIIKWKQFLTESPAILEIVINLVICIVAGILFYQAEKIVRNMWQGD